MKTIAALQFRRRFGEILDEVARTGRPVTVTRANRPLVVLVPAGGYGGAAPARAVREGRLRLAAERVAEWKARHADRLGNLDAVALVRAARSGHEGR